MGCAWSGPDPGSSTGLATGTMAPHSPGTAQPSPPPRRVRRVPEAGALCYSPCPGLLLILLPPPITINRQSRSPSPRSQPGLTRWKKKLFASGRFSETAKLLVNHPPSPVWKCSPAFPESCRAAVEGDGCRGGGMCLGSPATPNAGRPVVC